MIRPSSLFAAALALPLFAFAQAPPLAAPLSDIRESPAPERAPDAAPIESLAPTWETQKHARTYLLAVPAPRGQIVDRNGAPLAQTRVSYNLAIAFPTPLNFDERQVKLFAEQQAEAARTIIGRDIQVSPAKVLKHYQNRGIIPYVIEQDLKPGEVELIKQRNSQNLVLQATYQRFYPDGALAGHVIGYAGRTGRMPDGVIQNNDVLWPGAEGREGIEEAFDDQLQGKPGTMNISFDAAGRKASEQVTVPPQPGYNIVTTLDENIQRLCEQSLAKGCKRGSLVVMDPNSGDILALASWPTLNPNAFVPTISPAAYKALQDDKDIPLLPRAFRSAYPPGSTFKVFVGLAALNSGKIEPGDEFGCPPAFEVGNLTFRNWKKTDMGSMNFVGALTQSCNTWFYQCGIKIGGKVITDYCARLGLGQKTGIPLRHETEGRVMSEEYLRRVYKRPMFNGDVANLSIGQGDTLISPLQMAQAMAVIGNGGTLYQTRLVSQVQSVDGQIVTAYDVRARGVLEITEQTMEELREAMVGVVESRAGTAGRVRMDNVSIAGKTGTAQWGPKNNERTAAWFAGFAPTEKPRYAFAALYEGDANDDDTHGGTNAAPLIGRVLKEILKDDVRPKRKPRKSEDDDDETVEVAKAETPKPRQPAPTPVRRSFFNFFRPGAH